MARLAFGCHSHASFAPPHAASPQKGGGGEGGQVVLTPGVCGMGVLCAVLCRNGSKRESEEGNAKLI